jgi:uncharacterized membrane protein YeaQ/YmgE (transglycosylase-associated protein family)|tara:strand:+ start:449 stop:721 length:273 start_codon:yes stop_codon:yes gene_type:complete
MGLFWQIVSLLSVWLVYGVIASFFVKNSNKRDYLLILLSGFLGGLVGGLLANEIQIPDNIWYLSEFLKLVFAVFSMHGLQFIFKKTGFRQ